MKNAFCWLAFLPLSASAKDTETAIEFELKKASKVSLGVFDRASGRLIRTLMRGSSLKAGKHIVRWDGLDQRGKPVANVEHEWRLLSSPGFTARYITTIGINPPGGEHAVPRYSWVGDHVGAGIVDVDASGVYIGSPLTEGMMMLVKVDPTRSKVLWRRPQFYQSGRLQRAASSGKHVFMLHPNGKLRKLNKDTGRVEAVWQITSKGAAPSDVDARGENLVVTHPGKNAVHWLSTKTGRVLAQVTLKNVSSVAVLGEREKSDAIVGTGRDLYLVKPGIPARKVTTLPGNVTALDFDPGRKELWVVVDDHKIIRMNAAYQITKTYGKERRKLGPFDPTKFRGIYDIAADLKGGFFIGEPGAAPRRIAHVARDGSVMNQWFGGMSFYVGGTFDPDDPTRLYGIAPEGWVNVYRIDFDKGTWKIEGCYATGRLGDSLFPNAGSFRAIRKNGRAYLYHRVVPAVLRLDEKTGQAIPLAIAGRVLNRGRTFFQFAGTGRDGYPKPWVKAAEHHGFKDLKKAPKLYSWADTNGNGRFEPQEFRFYPKAKRGLSFHNPGDFTRSGDYLGTTRINASHALVRLPVAKWEGPKKSAPRWDWSKVEVVGKVLANSYGYGSPRCVSVGQDGSVSVAYQAGIMIRGHGQYEGGGWPEAALRGSRILGFNFRLQPIFEVGRQSKRADEANSGVLYYPMQTAFGPNQSIVVNDQTKQPAQVWSHDGLYVGGFFDHRAKDDLASGFYQLHGDDNQGATIVTSKSGKTYWLMPYVGHNRLYEIRGWKNWHRQSGRVTPPKNVRASSKKGTGLTARYSQGSRVILTTKEAPIYFEQFGREPHQGKVKAPYSVTWGGFVEAPKTELYRFTTLLGKKEQVAIWIDGKLIHTNGKPKAVDQRVSLSAGRRHRIRIQYDNPDGRAELKILWSSLTDDPARLSVNELYPDS